jgi:nicotinamide riboside transporter PnuC
MEIKKNDILFWIGIITSLWFAWTGMVWTYYACLVVAYPVGLVSFLIWQKIKTDNKPRNRFIPRILSVGLILSISVLIYLLIFD